MTEDREQNPLSRLCSGRKKQFMSRRDFLFEAGEGVSGVALAVLAFPGGHTHEHGVAKVRRGERYTMPGWYTRDSRHRDPSSLEVY